MTGKKSKHLKYISTQILSEHSVMITRRSGLCCSTASVHALLPARVLTVDFGQDAELNWLLPGSDHVAQVTVQKRLKTNNASPTQYMGSYSQQHGPVISDPFQGRVEWRLLSTSAPGITIKNATWSDEACYMCTFNVYTTGSQIQITCLSVQGKPHLAPFSWPSFKVFINKATFLSLL